MNENFLATDSRGLTRIKQIQRIVTSVTATELATLYSYRQVWFLVGRVIAARIAPWSERDTNCI